MSGREIQMNCCSRFPKNLKILIPKRGGEVLPKQMNQFTIKFLFYYFEMHYQDVILVKKIGNICFVPEKKKKKKVELENGKKGAGLLGPMLSISILIFFYL